jgi:phosphatidylglycerol:prolipoprotein diacylglycerol transferase
MHPILLDLGFFQLPTYGVLLATGVVAALWTLRLRGEKAGMDGTRLVDFALWLVIWALIGAKALLVIVELPRYLDDPASLLGVVRAGGVFLGGFIAAVITAVVLLRRYKLPALATFDVISPSLALGHSIGRIGCLMAGCCWGASCDLPWAVTYTDPVAAERLGTPLHQALHPFPLYSALFNVALYVLLAALYRRNPAPGRVFGTYLVLYGTGRFLLEWTRGDLARGFVLDGALSTSQAISFGLVVVGITLHAWVSRRRHDDHPA